MHWQRCLVLLWIWYCHTDMRSALPYLAFPLLFVSVLNITMSKHNAYTHTYTHIRSELEIARRERRPWTFSEPRKGNLFLWWSDSSAPYRMGWLTQEHCTARAELVRALYSSASVPFSTRKGQQRTLQGECYVCLLVLCFTFYSAALFEFFKFSVHLSVLR